MLRSARFGLLLHHDDEDREYSYDAGAENALGLARSEDWLVVSMKDDFSQVFAGTLAASPGVNAPTGEPIGAGGQHAGIRPGSTWPCGQP